MSTRRQFLRLGAAAVVGTAGCLGGTDDSPGGLDPDGPDGYPPAFEGTPQQRTIDTAGFDAVTTEGVDVPLAPIEDAYYWYRRGEARFADARSEAQYLRAHVYGAVLSPASGDRSDDPVEGWPKADRIVAYCGCPHHLSSIRAAKLIANGYEEVYVIDEGFWEWHDRGYPMVGSEVGTPPAARVIEGRTDPVDAGSSAWVTHEASGQYEATRIDEAGAYRLELRFADLTPRSRLAVETPSYRVVGTLADLTAGVVTGATN